MSQETQFITAKHNGRSDVTPSYSKAQGAASHKCCFVSFIACCTACFFHKNRRLNFLLSTTVYLPDRAKRAHSSLLHFVTCAGELSLILTARALI